MIIIKQELDTWDNLIIRACKSDGDRLRRLRKIFRIRCGLPEAHNVDDGLAYHMFGLVEKAPEISVRSVIESFNLENHWQYKIENDDYYVQVIKICACLLRNTNPNFNWTNFQPPAKFR